jgi:DNA-binding CsgD family transcriptional regulator
MYMNQNTSPETLLLTLTPEEHELFVWLREAITNEWIAETLMKDKREIKILAAEVYEALEVRDREELIAYYGALGKEAMAEVCDTEPDELARVLAWYSEKHTGV